MKLRITITGPRVHDVGYRYFLLGRAMGLRLPGFDASNLTDGKNQVVDIVIDGKESQVEAFKEYIENNKPSGAEVTSINISDYDGDVMPMAEYALGPYSSSNAQGKFDDGQQRSLEEDRMRS